MAFNLKTLFLLQLTIMGQKASDITVNHEKIVLKKGDEITLKCTSDSEASVSNAFEKITVMMV